ncbi:LytR/AlgR family response regulator transcription factor [Jiulongibacter sediminis]|uniref:HTH LytTR-type domain-containing protein n=1 Tax=Jiulongibacter sediminis TaxID=1605367 RepID=A0A0N8H9Z4_9BACT|nr:LytTR family DNA-binding domain-containing protein [Jiulongibacter sediminis]KPM48740.1 hypothetical protein AFM12_09150 [Jiulongibacter sediminis]TBX25274.1 hypothetical protein TK44_09155 [Jiulongibacter sediminis]
MTNTPTPKILGKDSNENVYFLTASSNYTFLSFSNGKRRISGYSLGFFENVLNDDFLRVNRSYLINKSFIDKVLDRGGKHFVRLKNNQEIRISRRKTSQILKVCKIYK